MDGHDGTIGILNVGVGDTTLSFDKNNPVERERAAMIVADMLKRGYAILVQVGVKDGEPLFQRIKAFDATTCEYIIAGGPDEHIDIGKPEPAEDEPEAVEIEAPVVHTRRRGRTRRIPAESTRAVSVGRTAGG